jgi:hypothetical protein
MFDLPGDYIPDLSLSTLMTDNGKVFSGTVPFHQHSQDSEIRSALSREEPPMQPMSIDSGATEIDNLSWDLITKCCAQEPDNRFTLSDIREWLTNQDIKDNRPPAKPLPGAEILQLRVTHFGVDIALAREVLARIVVSHQLTSKGTKRY